MTFAEVLRAALPGADKATMDYVLWNRTPYPMGKVTARSLYKTASSYRRAYQNGRQLCECCHRIATKDWLCERCDNILAEATQCAP